MKALVLSGGGSKGAYIAGAVKFLAEAGSSYDLFSGVSVGSINASALAQFDSLKPGADLLEKIWSKTSTKDVAKERFGGKFSLLWAPSIYKIDPLKKILNDNLDFSLFSTNNKILQIITVNLNSGEAETHSSFESKEELIEAIIASSVAPIVYPPSKFKNAIHVDGGIRHVSPLGAAIEAGATSIDVICCEAPGAGQWAQTKVGGALSCAPRVIQIMLSEITETDLKLTCLHNELKLAKPEHQKKFIELRICRPEVSLPADSTQFVPEISKKLMELGYIDAVKIFGQ